MLQLLEVIVVVFSSPVRVTLSARHLFEFMLLCRMSKWEHALGKPSELVLACTFDSFENVKRDSVVKNGKQRRRTTPILPGLAR